MRFTFGKGGGYWGEGRCRAPAGGLGRLRDISWGLFDDLGDFEGKLFYSNQTI